MSDIHVYVMCLTTRSIFNPYIVIFISIQIPFRVHLHHFYSINKQAPLALVRIHGFITGTHMTLTQNNSVIVYIRLVK